MMLVNKIRPKLLKAITKYGVDLEVYRTTINDFGESNGDNTLVTTLKGLYSESNHSINQINVDAGKIKKDKTYKLIVLINDESKKLLEEDLLLIKGTNFKLINISNANMLDVYYELTLKRC